MSQAITKRSFVGHIQRELQRNPEVQRIQALTTRVHKIEVRFKAVHRNKTVDRRWNFDCSECSYSFLPQKTSELLKFLRKSHQRERPEVLVEEFSSLQEVALELYSLSRFRRFDETSPFYGFTQVIESVDLEEKKEFQDILIDPPKTEHEWRIRFQTFMARILFQETGELPERDQPLFRKIQENCVRQMGGIFKEHQATIVTKTVAKCLFQGLTDTFGSDPLNDREIDIIDVWVNYTPEGSEYQSQFHFAC